MATAKKMKVGTKKTGGINECALKLAAIDRTQAVIEFHMDGTVITANENFLKTLGYTLDEIKGQHHRMFCDAAYVNSPDYQAFWANLNRGDLSAGREGRQESLDSDRLLPAYGRMKWGSPLKS